MRRCFNEDPAPEAALAVYPPPRCGGGEGRGAPSLAIPLLASFRGGRVTRRLCRSSAVSWLKHPALAVTGP